MQQVRAIHTIYRNPTGRKVSSGKLDEFGNVIMQAAPELVKPGETFQVANQAEYDDLLANGAIVAAQASESEA